MTRQQPLTIVVNSGEQQGLKAWQKLIEQYEPNQRTRFAGQLQALLGWKFSGDVESKLEAFEREIVRWEQGSGEQLSDSIRIGIVLRQLEESQLKQHLVMNAQRLVLWRDFKREVSNIRRAQINLGPVPMDLDALRTK
eukprot:6470061-Amphidinium_carterae.1